MLININQKKNFNFYLFSISYRALKKPVRVVCVSGGCVWFDTVCDERSIQKKNSK